MTLGTQAGEQVDLVREFTNLIRAETAYAASARLIQTADELSAALLEATA